MELMSPAGTKESFVAAVKAGANAVYTGLQEFNARIRADNLNIHDLHVLSSYAAANEVKTYLTLNVLIKQHEIKDVYRLLKKVLGANIDAVIVQDMGVARILGKFFPDTDIHASTQLAVHNSYGAQEMERYGFKRVILSRELSLPEIKQIAKKSRIEVEVFCHGALCFSISGMCLFSSFLGGYSGNRGLCAQPCRRKWAQGNKVSNPFSPLDLQAAALIGELMKSGIAAMKIEGRMRSPEYVYKATKAYRLLIDSAGSADSNEMIEEAMKLLDDDMARSKTTCMLKGLDKSIFSSSARSVMGKVVGKTMESSKSLLKVNLNEELAPGDRIRIESRNDRKPLSVKVRELNNMRGICEIKVDMDEAVSGGLNVYRAGGKFSGDQEISDEVTRLFKEYKPAKPVKNNRTIPEQLPGQWLRDKRPVANEELFVRFNNTGWMDVVGKDKAITPIYCVSTEDTRNASRVEEQLEQNSNMVFELPPFIGQRDLQEHKMFIDSLISSGANSWVINNISQIRFFSDADVELRAGHFLYSLNTSAAQQLRESGVDTFTFSWEDDILNLKGISRAGIADRLLVYLYGYPAIARSRMLPADSAETIRGFSAQDGRVSFRLEQNNGQTVIIPAKPVALFNSRNKLLETGIRKFGIDLSFIEPGIKVWKEITEAYSSSSNPQDTVKFNFKNGLM